MPRTTSNSPKILLILVVGLFLSSMKWTPIAVGSDIDYSQIANKIDMSSLKEQVRYFESLGSRVTGYPGCEAAASYILNYFKNHGLKDVQYHNFTTASVIDYGATIDILLPEGMTLKAFPLGPNLVVPVMTPPEGIVGDLVYAGNGDLEDFNGKSIEGNIVLLEYNGVSGCENALKLGARLVIFIEPEDTTMTGQHSLPLQVNFPRVYVSKSDGAYLKGLAERGSAKLKVTAKTQWENVVGSNVIGYLPGESSTIVILSSYYDSGSIVPSLAPGANQALGIATLLELVKLFEGSTPRWTLMFVAFSGHNQALSGSRWFFNDYLLKKDLYEKVGKRFGVQINLDLSSGSSSMAPVYHGATYDHPGYFETYINMLPFQKSFFDAESEIESQVGMAFDVPTTALMGVSNLLAPYVSGIFPLDSEPYLISAAYAYSIVTLNDIRRYVSTPLDTFERLNFDNFEPQLVYIFCQLWRIVKTDLTSYLILPRPAPLRNQGSFSVGFKTLKGKICYYDPSKAWYDPLPNALVVISYYAPMVHFADENGSFFIPGLYSWTYGTWTVSAYKIDTNSGNILYSPDLGTHSFAGSKLDLAKAGDVDLGIYALFECSTIVLTDTIIPNSLNVPFVENQLTDFSFESYEPDTWGFPEFFGSQESWRVGGAGWAYLYGTAISAVNLPPNFTAMIAPYSLMYGRYPISLITNSSDANLKGQGYTLDAGQQIVLKVADYVKSIYDTDKDRIIRLTAYGIDTTQSDMELGELTNLVQAMDNALATREYDTAEFLSLQAWKRGWELYKELRAINDDNVNSVPVFSSLAVPFALLAGGLLFGLRGRRAFLSMIAIFISLNVVFYLLHPGYRMSSNSVIVSLSFIMLFSVIPTLAVIYTNILDLIQQISMRFVRLHLIDVRRISILGTAITTGIEHARKRKLRLGLTLASIGLISMSVVLASSLQAISVTRSISIAAEPTYSGIFLRYRDWAKGTGPGISVRIMDSMSILFQGNATIRPRAWLYPATGAPGQNWWPVQFRNETYAGVLGAILGITFDDPTHAEAIVQAGRWFEPDDLRVCIISDYLAHKIGLQSLPADVIVGGTALRVIGIFANDKVDKLKGLNGESILPLFTFLPEPRYDFHFTGNATMMLPYKTAIELGGKTTSLSIVFNKQDYAIPKIAESVFKSFSELEVYFTQEQNNKTSVSLYTKGSQVQVTGGEYQLIPIAIVAITLTNLMLGTLHERTKEIFTMSAVGAAPLHISFMFLVESIEYAIVGGVSGYVLAMLVTHLATQFAPGSLFVNFSSQWSVIALFVSMIATVVGSIYPMYKSATLVTPSAERAWRIPTQPKAGEWTIPYPFVFGQQDASAFINYITEFLQMHRSKEATIFLVESEITEAEDPGAKYIDFEARLSPFAENVKQETRFEFRRVEANKVSLAVHLKRISGSDQVWVTSNRFFLDEIRKQALLWRSLGEEEKQPYSKKGEI